MSFFRRAVEQWLYSYFRTDYDPLKFLSWRLAYNSEYSLNKLIPPLLSIDWIKEKQNLYGKYGIRGAIRNKPKWKQTTLLTWSKVSN